MIAGKLWRYELYKVVFSYRGLWLIIAFLFLKIAVLCVLPELKDSRIELSQKQYDTVLETIAGETTPEKEQYIAYTYAHYRSVVDQFVKNQDSYLTGKMAEDDWIAYTEEYDMARLYLNAFSIFNEKVEQFSALQPLGDLPPAYFYEYGWDSIFIYLGYPDPLSFLLVLMLGIQFICPEIASGALQVVLTTKHGRRPLFLSKLAAILTLLCTIAVINASLEVSILSMRFSLFERHWPLYSITPFAAHPIHLSLAQGLTGLAIIRGAGFILAGLLVWAVACLAGNTSHAAFCAVALFLMPWLFIPNAIFTMSAWLSGVPVLVAENRLPGFALLIAITALLWLAYNVRFRGKEKCICAKRGPSK